MAGNEKFKSKYGPWALVTGASSGIGKAIAEELATRGLNVVLVARNQEALKQTAEVCQSRAVSTRVIVLDLSTPEANKSLNDQTKDLDIGLVAASAGFGASGPFLQADLAEEWQMLTLNAGSTLSISNLFGQRLAARGRGGLILLSSIVGMQGTPWCAGYAATKAYVQSLAESLHYEFHPQGVDVLSCAPGPVNSGFAKRANMTLGQANTPEFVAKKALNALGHKVTIIPGLLPRLLIASLAFLPRPLKTRLMAGAMSSLVNKQRE